ncbi:MAG TPA: DUF2336 domain-containing protein [Allosphingosinicella sp.]|nr:DUF2336 domain-containing protein [Allosphingosinicella sp.]
MAQTSTNGRDGQSDTARLMLAAARERFAVAATDLLLPDAVRLTEWQRLTAAKLLGRIVRGIEDDLRSRLAVTFRDLEALHAALSSAHVAIALPILERAQVLRDAEISNILVRRVEEHRFWKKSATARESYLFQLVRDPDEAIAADAMAVVIARSRRFDRFEDAAIGQVELPADLQHKLVWMVAAALRQYISQQHAVRSVDAAVEEAATTLIAGYDEGENLESQALRLAQRLYRSGRLDGAALAMISAEGVLPLFIAGLSVLCALDHVATWEVLSDPRGRGPALLLRAAGVARDEAAAILLALNEHGPFITGLEGDAVAAQLDLYDTVDELAARDVLRLWQAHPSYRASVARISTRARPAAEAA